MYSRVSLWFYRIVHIPFPSLCISCSFFRVPISHVCLSCFQWWTNPFCIPGLSLKFCMKYLCLPKKTHSGISSYPMSESFWLKKKLSSSLVILSNLSVKTVSTNLPSASFMKPCSLSSVSDYLYTPLKNKCLISWTSLLPNSILTAGPSYGLSTSYVTSSTSSLIPTCFSSSLNSRPPNEPLGLPLAVLKGELFWPCFNPHTNPIKAKL